jgi:hypothetical protein
VVVLTGSGRAFMESICAEGFDFFTPQGYDQIYLEGKKVLMNILERSRPNRPLRHRHRAVYRLPAEGSERRQMT